MEILLAPETSHGWRSWNLQGLLHLSQTQDPSEHCFIAFISFNNNLTEWQCDQKRPACGQCIYGQRVCEGYNKATVFLNHFSTTFKDSAPSAETCEPIPHNVVDRGNCVQVPQGVLSTREEGIHLPLYPLSSSMSRHLLIHNNHPLAQFVNSAVPVSASRQAQLSWMNDLVGIVAQNRALSYAGAAIGYGWAGHIEKQSHVIRRGQMCYSDALSSLRASYRGNAGMSTENRLKTMALLLLYEVRPVHSKRLFDANNFIR